MKLLEIILQEDYLMSRPAWARGLKPSGMRSIVGTIYVAPRVGAWIETHIFGYTKTRLLSRPAWARGLKPTRQAEIKVCKTSRPAWARGLKLDNLER